jgi:hypothetical protein
MRLRGRLFRTSWRRESAVSGAVLAKFGPTAMAATAATLWIKAPTLVGIPGWVWSEHRSGRRHRGGRLLYGRSRDWQYNGRRSHFRDYGSWRLDHRGSDGRCKGCGCACLLVRELGGARFRFLKDLVVFFLVFIKVGNVKEGVAFEADINKRRLHAGKHAADASFVNAADQADVGISFEIHLDQLVVFKHGHFRLVRRRGNIHLLRHVNSFFRNARDSIRQMTEIDQQRS